MKLTEGNFSSRIKYFAPVWLYPFLAILAAVNEELNGAEETWFNEQLIVWVFLLVNLPLMYAWMKGKIPVKEMIIFWWFAPFLIWVGVVYVKLALVG